MVKLCALLLGVSIATVPTVTRVAGWQAMARRPSYLDPKLSAGQRKRKRARYENSRRVFSSIDRRHLGEWLARLAATDPAVAGYGRCLRAAVASRVETLPEDSDHLLDKSEVIRRLDAPTE